MYDQPQLYDDAFSYRDFSAEVRSPMHWTDHRYEDLHAYAYPRCLDSYKKWAELEVCVRYCHVALGQIPDGRISAACYRWQQAAHSPRVGVSLPAAGD